MTKDKNIVPNALKEVWEWKEKVYNDSADLKTLDALERIGEDMDKVKLRYGLIVAAPPGIIAAAEETGSYKCEK